MVPTFVQEAGDQARPIKEKITEVAQLPAVSPFTLDEVAEIARLGDNTGCMTLKGASRRHETSERPDEWPMRPDLEPLNERWNLASIN